MLGSRPWLVFGFLIVLTFVAIMVALPADLPFQTKVGDQEISLNLGLPRGPVTMYGRSVALPNWELKKGLDIQGGLQVTLEADMASVSASQRNDKLKEVQTIISNRVDLYGLNETSIQSSRLGDKYRLLVELPGVTDTDEALQLIGKTAKLDFKLQKSATGSAIPPSPSQAAPELSLTDFERTDLNGEQLMGAEVQFDPDTNEPQIALQFDPAGTQLFNQITSQNIGKRLGIFIDDQPLAVPTINVAIPDGRAVISGGFTVDQAKELEIQLNAGSLPVSLNVVEQRMIGSSLGQVSINQTITAGLIGLGLVMVFMILNYGYRGVIAVIALALYGIYTLALYKVLGVTLTVPGIAGLLLSIGMAVDSNILIFERMKEELRLERPFKMAMERGFGRAWKSIKDANIVTILIALILINPLHLGFLNSSGLVRGFGMTLLVGIVVSLFTGIVVTRNLMRLFLPAPREAKKHV